ncbi:MAG: carbohydrate kinase [Lachnospiraceae bacterium]|nr:carbohydrate kinase [Lachnospiraceae bacterium]
MKQVLVIGSTVVDVIIKLPHLPKTSEDVHVLGQTMSLGGCAYNTSDTIRHFGVPYILFSPVGTGTYGHFVREELKKRGIQSPIPTPLQENGCCYCFVENSGERTFASYHGAEYLFYPEWFELLDADSIDSVYICGLEIEETTGPNIVQYLEGHPSYRIFFAPGPRIQVISQNLLDRLFALSPILHLNETEVLEYTGEPTIEQAARSLFTKTQNTVIVTLGEKGAYYDTGQKAAYVSGVTAQQIDTIGAGDSHIGAVIARLQQGAQMEDAIRDANRVSAAVVETNGALLSEEAFKRLGLS